MDVLTFHFEVNNLVCRALILFENSWDTHFAIVFSHLCTFCSLLYKATLRVLVLLFNLMPSAKTEACYSIQEHSKTSWYFKESSHLMLVLFMIKWTWPICHGNSGVLFLFFFFFCPVFSNCLGVLVVIIILRKISGTIKFHSTLGCNHALPRLMAIMCSIFFFLVKHLIYLFPNCVFILIIAIIMLWL